LGHRWFSSTSFFVLSSWKGVAIWNFDCPGYISDFVFPPLFARLVSRLLMGGLCFVAHALPAGLPLWFFPRARVRFVAWVFLLAAFFMLFLSFFYIALPLRGGDFFPPHRLDASPHVWIFLRPPFSIPFPGDLEAGLPFPGQGRQAA